MRKKIGKTEQGVGSFLSQTVMTYVSGMMFINQIRSYVKSYPHLKDQVITSLELLIQELKNDK